MSGKFILNADDFGMSNEFNNAVLEGYRAGVLKSASLCANGIAYDEAVNKIIPCCDNLSVGIHLNIIEGKSLTDAPMLTDKNRNFNNDYISLIVKSFDKKFMSEVEAEFKAQIEKICSKIEIDHIDSHVHTHAIPNIFKLVVKLAKEYKIPYIRTQYEKPYIIPDIKKNFNKKHIVNILKIILLNTFTYTNKNYLKNKGLMTNDYLIGVGYTGMMNSEAVEYGLKALEGDFIAEALIHPCKYEKQITDSHSVEFLITKDVELKEKIKNMNIEIINHSLRM